MMDPGVRIAAAASVLLGGILVALLFRRDEPAEGPPAPGREQLVLPKQTDLPEAVGPSGRIESPSSVPRPADIVGPSANVVMPADRGQTPPEIAREDPDAIRPTRSGWGTPIGLPPLPRRDDGVRTHRIVDGDSLDRLAERYLGSADRRLEIYEANRDVLPSPELLPIGVELKIPAPSGAVESP